MADVRFALVYRTGGDFTAEYVNRLADSLAPYGHVVCLSDSKEAMNCEIRPLETDWPGWWSKLELFRQFTKGRTVYFDLDTVINGDPSKLAQLSGDFYMLSDLYTPERLASGVMVWNGDYSYIADAFKPEIHIKEYSIPSKHGDQAFIANHIKVEPHRLQYACPGLITSYKAHNQEQKKASAVVCYHGKPRPHQTGWKV